MNEPSYELAHALWCELPAIIMETVEVSDVREWLRRALAVTHHTVAPAPAEAAGAAGQCGAAGPDGLRCERAPGHLPILDEATHHAAYADESGELVRW